MPNPDILNMIMQSQQDPTQPPQPPQDYPSPGFTPGLGMQGAPTMPTMPGGGAQGTLPPQQQATGLAQLMGHGTQLSDRDVQSFLMSQAFAQNTARQMQSPDLQTRAYGMAASGALPFVQAHGQAPMLQHELQRQQSQDVLKQLETLVHMQQMQAQTGLVQAQTQAEPYKSGQKISALQGEKLDLDKFKAGVDQAYKAAELKFKELGLMNDAVKTDLDRQRLELMDRAAGQRDTMNQLHAAEIGLKISQAAQQDPQLSQALNAIKVLPPDQRTAYFNSIRPLIEQKTGIKMTDDRGFIDKLLNTFGLGGEPSSVGQPIPGAGGRQGPPLPNPPQINMQNPIPGLGTVQGPQGTPSVGPQQPPLNYGPAPGMGLPRTTPGQVKKTMQAQPPPTQPAEDEILKGLMGE